MCQTHCCIEYGYLMETVITFMSQKYLRQKICRRHTVYIYDLQVGTMYYCTTEKYNNYPSEINTSHTNMCHHKTKVIKIVCDFCHDVAIIIFK